MVKIGISGHRGRDAITLLGAIVLSGCVSVPVPGLGGSRSLVDAPVEQHPATMTAAAKGPPASVFIGRPAGELESVIGRPSLVTKEGAGEFRRYDLGDCRVYAMVQGRASHVVNLSVGPARVGMSPTPFDQCVVNALNAG